MRSQRTGAKLNHLGGQLFNFSLSRRCFRAEVFSNTDIRWLQRLEDYERALATLERALTLAASRPLSELESKA